MPDATKLRHLRRLRADGPTTDAERSELEHADNVYGDRWWMPATEQRWLNTADAVQAFHETTGRWPTVKSPQPEEARLGIWLVHQRSSQRSQAPWFTEQRQAYLDENTPGWITLLRERWQATADELARFYRHHHTWPSTKSSDPDEKRIGAWLSQQRVHKANNDPRLTRERRDYLSHVAPGWDGGREAAWQQRLSEVAAFIEANSGWPSASAGTKDERQLARWLSDQLSDARSNSHRFTAERRAALDATIPGWDTPRKVGRRPRRA